MATITIIRSIEEQGISSARLISIFQRQSINYNIERGALIGTYSTVSILDYEFRAIKVDTLETTDSYIIDVSNILMQIMYNAPNEVDDDIIRSIVIKINLYDNTNTLVTSLDCDTVLLCFGYPDINSAYGMNDVYVKGSSRPIYHNGKISFMWSGTDGLKQFTIGGINHDYSVFENTYRTYSLDATQNINGTLTTASLATFSIPLYYKPPYGEHEIAWLNRDGGWSFWNFRQVSSEIKVKKSNEVATYYPTNYQTISKSRMISAEKTVEYVFDTLAYNPEHFAQLCEIQESLAVIWNNKLMTVSGCNSLTAVCKQNLRFTLKLEIDENIAGY